MMCEWEGRAVSVTVKDKGSGTQATATATGVSCFQGTITAADGNSITLTKPFKDGFPYPDKSIHLLAADIENIEIIEADYEGGAGGEGGDRRKHSTVPLIKSAKKMYKANRAEEPAQPDTTMAGASRSLPNDISEGRLSAFNGNHQRFDAQNDRSESALNDYYGRGSRGTAGDSRSKPIDIQGRNNRINGNGFIYPPIGGTPHKRDRDKKRNDACFGTPSDDPGLNEDFDFEKNLALFNKQAIWEKLNKNKKCQTKQAENGKRNNCPNQKMKHNENVIEPSPTVYKPIIIPNEQRGKLEYVTDDGFIVPSISSDLRMKLFTNCGKAGLKGTELLGRATSEVALQLLGGSRRLNPRNAHQAPTVAFLIGPHRQGVVGVMCATQLASLGVSTVVLVAGAETNGNLRKQVSIYRMTGNRLITDASDLPESVDLIIVALCEDQRESEDHSRLAEWTNGCRAPVMAIDPPGNGTPGITTKYSIIPTLPLSYSNDNGKLYLCNLAVPIKIYGDLGIQYASPFGSKFVIALHPNDAS